MKEPARDRAVVCWEALDSSDPVLDQARHLYESTLPADERIPWAWVEGAVGERVRWRPGRWSPHLLLAAPQTRRGTTGKAIGYAYGVHVPGYGGYPCYLGIEPGWRGRGVATMLLRLLIRLLQTDAACEGVPLRFVVWESRAPGPEATPDEQTVWRARLGLFRQVGAWEVAGLTFLAPNFARRQGPPVPLQLFLTPVDAAPTDFDAEALRAVVAGLYEGVYRRTRGDPLFDRTLSPDCRPELRPLSPP